MVKHFLEIDDLTVDEITEILDRAESNDVNQILKRKSVVLLFEKPSSRTRQSMENAVVQLGGNSIYVRPDETGIDERESAEDVAKTLSLFDVAIAARVFDHSKLTRMANASSVPVINLLSDQTHPIQTLADLLTLRQSLKKKKKLKVSYIGDPNNVSRPLAIALNMFGNTLNLSHPKGYGLSASDLNKFESGNVKVNLVDDPKLAAENADVIYTDTWYSMGQEDQKDQRVKDFKDYQINSELMSRANAEAIFMHCLPAHRGLEVTDEVIDGPQSVVWKQAENRMHTARGLLSYLCE